MKNEGRGAKLIFQIMLIFTAYVFIFPHFSLANDSKSTAAPQNIKKQKVEYQKYRFTPHITAEAVTRARGGFAVQRAVGANLNTHFLHSTVTYALLNRLEIGTKLFTYLYDEHKYNFSLKYNFYRGEQFFWSIGYFTSVENFYKLAPTDLKPFTHKDSTLHVGGLQLLFNYLPKNSNFKYGVNYNTINLMLNNYDGTEQMLVLGAQGEFGIDISYAHKDLMDVTLGFGWMRENGLTATEEVAFGFGTSVRWYRPKAFISSPTPGLHYTPSTGNVAFTFTTSFY